LSPAITEGNRTLPLEAEVPNPAGKLRPGTFARAEIITSEAPGLVIPSSALVVFAGVEKVLLAQEGKVKEQRVRSGRRYGETVEIVEGLDEGALVIIEPRGLADGAAVRVTS
jgi:multidrug efflux pump subunit AcrA (membrane-fusion protein)